MHTQTLNAIIRAFHSTSKDETRYRLQHVFIKRQDEKIVIQSSDGFVMSCVTLEDAELSETMGDTTFAVSPDNLVLLKIVAKSYKRMNDLHCERTEDALLVGKEEFGPVVRIKAINDHVSPPPFETLKPKWEAVMTIGLNPELLLALAKALTDRKTKNLRLDIKDQHSAIKVTAMGADGVENMGVIMPVRV